MKRLRILVVIAALLEAGWMTFDGTRALVVGDYVTASSGEYAGQLGPWHLVVGALGIEPRSTLMKTIFVVYGTIWLAIIVAFTRRAKWGWGAMVGAAFGALWYLPIGTIFSIVQLGALAWVRRSPEERTASKFVPTA